MACQYNGALSNMNVFGVICFINLLFLCFCFAVLTKVEMNSGLKGVVPRGSLCFFSKTNKQKINYFLLFPIVVDHVVIILLKAKYVFFGFDFRCELPLFLNQFNFCLQVKCNFQLRPWTLYIQVLANVFVVKFFALFDCLLLNLRCCCFVALHFPLGARRYKGSRSSISANIDIARHRVIAL